MTIEWGPAPGEIVFLEGTEEHLLNSVRFIVYTLLKVSSPFGRCRQQKVGLENLHSGTPIPIPSTNKVYVLQNHTIAIATIFLLLL